MQLGRQLVPTDLTEHQIKMHGAASLASAFLCIGRMRHFPPSAAGSASPAAGPGPGSLLSMNS